MPQSLARVYLHLVFSTKKRTPFLADPSIRTQMHAYLATILTSRGCEAEIVGGVEDHVHLLCRMSRTISIADLVRDLKRGSTKWVASLDHAPPGFDWQDGYGAFSISPSHLGLLREYIRDQESHHRTESFQDEFRRLLTKYGVEFDERFVWD